MIVHGMENWGVDMIESSNIGIYNMIQISELISPENRCEKMDLAVKTGDWKQTRNSLWESKVLNLKGQI